MMLRSKKVVANISGVAIKRKMARNRSVLKKQSLSETHIEGKTTRKRSRSILHHGTDLCRSLSSCDCISGVEQSSSVAEHSSISQAKNSPFTEVGKCNSAVVPSSTSSPRVLTNSDQTGELHPSSVLEDSVRSLEMEDSIVEVIPIEVSDVCVLETKSYEPLSNNNRSADTDTADVIIIPDSPVQGSVGNNDLKNTSHEISLLQQGRKRKISDESGVEFLCDIAGSRPKKQQKMECNIKEKKLWTNTTIKDNFAVTLSGTDRKISQVTKNEKSGIINITSKRSSGDGDDIIFIGAEDEEVSVINTKEQKPPQEDVIILDSPPVQTPVQSSDKKTKKLVSVSTSVTGLIPHYTQHLIDYISLDGKPPATTSGSSTGTPEHIPVVKGWSPKVKHRRKQRAMSRSRLLNARNHNPAVHSGIAPLCPFPPPSHTSTGNETSTVYPFPPPSHTSTGNETSIVFPFPPPSHTSTGNETSAVNNSTQNSTVQNVAPENSVQSPPEVSQSPACAYGTNIYNPNARDKEEDGLRPVIIDGNNIAMGHGKGKSFSWRGLHICIKYFLKRGHKVTAFVPRFRKGICPPELRSEMEEYERSGQVVFTPSRRVEGRLIVPYDDRFIVQCAAELGGVIVSTDNFRDLLDENSSWKETIQKRLLMFTWVGDLLMFPHDPLGRTGPLFEEFLRFPKK